MSEYEEQRPPDKRFAWDRRQIAEAGGGHATQVRYGWVAALAEDRKPNSLLKDHISGTGHERWTSRDVWECGEESRITSATAARVRKDQIRRQKRVEGGGTVQKNCTGGLQAKSRRRRREKKPCCGWIDRHTKRSRYQLWSRTPGSVIGWRVEVGVDTEQRRIW